MIDSLSSGTFLSTLHHVRLDRETGTSSEQSPPEITR